MIEEHNLVEERDRVVGEGSFGKVYAGKYAGTPVVIKHLKDPLDREAFLREADFLDNMLHPNIVSILAYDRSRIVLEKYDSDARHLEGDEEVTLVARDCMRGLAYMHTHNGCTRHGDIKPANILLKFDSSGKLIKAALGDMGLARACHKRQMIGTRGYMPFIRGSSDRMHDVFALGVSLLNATFDQHVHCSRATYDTVSDYPVSGPEHDSEDNTMYYANKMPVWMRNTLAQMLVLVHREGDTEQEKTRITLKILEQWETLVNMPGTIGVPVPAVLTVPMIPDISMGSEDDVAVNPANMMMGTSESGPLESMGQLDEVRDSDFEF